MRGEVSLGIQEDEIPVIGFPINGDTKRFSKLVKFNGIEFKVIVDLFAE